MAHYNAWYSGFRLAPQGRNDSLQPCAFSPVIHHPDVVKDRSWGLAPALLGKLLHEPQTGLLPIRDEVLDQAQPPAPTSLVTPAKETLIPREVVLVPPAISVMLMVDVLLAKIV